MKNYYIGWIIVAIIIIAAIVLALKINRQQSKSVAPLQKFERVKTSKTRDNVLKLIAIMIIGALSIYHLTISDTFTSFYGPIILVLFIWMMIMTYLSFTYYPYKNSVPDLKTMVIIPSYNEDPETTYQVLKSIVNQSHPADYIVVVDDGSKKSCRSEDVVRKINAEHPLCNLKYIYQENMGKREAQFTAIDSIDEHVDIYITIDSDTLLGVDAIKNGLMPFIDNEVMAVAGLLVNQNNQSVLTKTIGIGFISSFTSGRAAWSTLNSVAVSCGGLALYRATVLDTYREAYLNQIIFGEKARYGDDRMLTQYASLEGKTVYQESAIGYTLVPENLSHLHRQRLRWWKSYWWGVTWLLVNQSPKRPIWWLGLSQFITTALYNYIFISCYLIGPIISGHFPFDIIIYMFILSYMKMLSSLRIIETNKSLFRQIINYLVYVPLTIILNIYVCSILQVVALFKLREVKSWGTRDDIEVKLSNPNQD